MNSSFDLTLSNNINYIFDVYISTLNPAEKVQFFVTVKWSSEEEHSWTTSFIEDKISEYCSYICQYLTGDNETSQDTQLVSSIFFTILNTVKDIDNIS